MVTKNRQFQYKVFGEKTGGATNPMRGGDEWKSCPGERPNGIKPKGWERTLRGEGTPWTARKLCERTSTSATQVHLLNYRGEMGKKEWISRLYKVELQTLWKSLSQVRLFATPWTVYFMEFFKPEYWSGVAFPSFRGSSQLRDRTQVSCIVGRVFISWAMREALVNIESESQCSLRQHIY